MMHLENWKRTRRKVCKKYSFNDSDSPHIIFLILQIKMNIGTAVDAIVAVYSYTKSILQITQKTAQTCE